MKIILYLCLVFSGASLLFAKGAMDTIKSNTVETAQDDPNKAESDYQRYIKDKAGDLIIEKDKFENRTVIKTNFGRGWANRNELEFFKHKGEDGFDLAGVELKIEASIFDSKKNSDQYVLLFKTTNPDTPFGDKKIDEKNFKFMDCNDFHWLVDGAPLSFVSEKYSNHVGKDLVDTIETFTVVLNKKQFEKLAVASTVECKICDTQFVFNKKHFWVLRWVMERAKELRATKETNTKN